MLDTKISPKGTRVYAAVEIIRDAAGGITFNVIQMAPEAAPAFQRLGKFLFTEHYSSPVSLYYIGKYLGKFV